MLLKKHQPHHTCNKIVSSCCVRIVLFCCFPKRIQNLLAFWTNSKYSTFPEDQINILYHNYYSELEDSMVILYSSCWMRMNKLLSLSIFWIARLYTLDLAIISAAKKDPLPQKQTWQLRRNRLWYLTIEIKKRDELPDKDTDKMAEFPVASLDRWSSFVFRERIARRQEEK